MQFIHQMSKTSIKALFWVFLEGATVFNCHTYLYYTLLQYNTQISSVSLFSYH